MSPSLSVTKRACAAGVGAALLLAGLTSAPSRAQPTPAGDSARLAQASATQPNILFVLVDDQATQELRYMPNVRRYVVREGAEFRNYQVDSPLCCPSRTSIFTGLYPQNTQVLSNEYPGGFSGFHTYDESTTFAVALQQAGYTTALAQKFLNEYPYVESSPANAVPDTYIAQGWSHWFVPVAGEYHGNRYTLNQDGALLHLSIDDDPANYLGDYTTRQFVRLIRANADGQGLMLEFSPFSPHVPFPASPVEKQDRTLRRYLRQLTYPRLPYFNEADVSDKPAYIQARPLVGQDTIDLNDARWRRKLRADATIDREFGQLVRALQRTGQWDNTYVVYSSDNGYHFAGDHRLAEGKDSFFNEDINQTLAIRGPGIPAGTTVDQVTSNVDLAATFADMAGTTLPYEPDGASLLPLAQGHAPSDWTHYVYLIQGHPKDYSDALGEPGTAREAAGEAAITLFHGVIGNRYKLISDVGCVPDPVPGGDPYARVDSTCDTQFYDERNDPYELDNLAAQPFSAFTQRQQRHFKGALQALLKLRSCRGVADCTVH